MVVEADQLKSAALKPADGHGKSLCGEVEHCFEFFSDGFRGAGKSWMWLMAFVVIKMLALLLV